MPVTRCAPVVNRIRLSTPYVNFNSRPSPADCDQPDLSISSSKKQISHLSDLEIKDKFTTSTWACYCHGFGSRHGDDLAPFSLWDPIKEEFRYPTEDEGNWISKTYNATCWETAWPKLRIFTKTPPSPVPLTVGCVAANFLPPLDHFLDTVEDSDSITTPYVNPRGTDPLRPLQIPRWRLPTASQWEMVANCVCSLVNVAVITFYGGILHVEIPQDGREYLARSLPPRIGGMTAFYHHQSKSYWGNLESQTIERVIDPLRECESGPREDTTDYLSQGQFGPGVRVESSVATDVGPYATLSRATTAGVLLRNTSGLERVTVACHGFREANAVYHPTNSQHCIGEVHERIQAYDWGLVKLAPSAAFTNKSYFQAQPPKRLLQYHELQHGEWCAADGMSTGIIFLMVNGIRSMPPPNPTGHREKIHFADWNHETAFESIGPTGGKVKEGLFGAPIVHDDEGGGVAGFFHLSNGRQSFSPILDNLINRGWAIV